MLTACECSLVAWTHGGEIQVCSWRENAAVVSPEHITLRTERDPSMLVACERSGLGDPRGGDFACARAAVALTSY